jgi:hypothetical protein
MLDENESVIVGLQIPVVLAVILGEEIFIGEEDFISELLINVLVETGRLKHIADFINFRTIRPVY